MASIAALAVVGVAVASAEVGGLTIDDFSVVGESSLGTRWEGFSDRVMGGISMMRAGYERDADGLVLRMAGDVSLENNGGFIQVRLPLANQGTFDASSYTGIVVEVRGVPGSYYVHLRTRNTRLPWQYYAAPIPVSDRWERVEIPFSSFTGESTIMSLSTERLQSLAIVAGNDAFSADISIRRLELY